MGLIFLVLIFFSKLSSQAGQDESSWVDGKIYYKFSETFQAKHQKAKIHKWMAHMETKFPCIQFEIHDEGDGNFITITAEEDNCSRKGMVLNLGRSCLKTLSEKTGRDIIGDLLIDNSWDSVQDVKLVDKAEVARMYNCPQDKVDQRAVLQSLLDLQIKMKETMATLDDQMRTLEESFTDAVGPPGFAGPKGYLGQKGDKGFPGRPGNLGLQGQKGEVGIKGLPGITCDYEHTLEGVIKVCDGRQGFPGIPGQKGDAGRPGLPGPVGPEGPEGPPGLEGAPGYQGPKGDRGYPGIVGNRGVNGDKGTKGTPPPQPPCNDPAGCIPVVGPPGAPGMEGDKGIIGYVGLPGDPGDKGYQGMYGLDGDSGIPGIKGERGIPGRSGAPGLPGQFGPKGKPGRCISTPCNGGPTTKKKEKQEYDTVESKKGLFIAGGFGATTNVELFIPSTNQSCELNSSADLPYGMWYHTLDGQYVCKDYSCYNFTGQFGWEETHSLKTKRMDHSSWVTDNGSLVLMGGYMSPLRTEILSLTWKGGLQSTEEHFPLKHKTRRNCAIPLKYGTHVILTGGWHTPKTVSKYNSNTGWVEDLPDLNEGRRNHGCGSYVLESQSIEVLVVAGGWDGDRSVYLDSTEVFHLGESYTSGQWSMHGPLPSARDSLKGVVLNNTIFMTGGEIGTDLYTNEILCWDHQLTFSGVWKHCGEMKNSRTVHAVTTIDVELVKDYCTESLSDTNPSKKETADKTDEEYDDTNDEYDDPDYEHYTELISKEPLSDTNPSKKETGDKTDDEIDKAVDLFDLMDSLYECKEGWTEYDGYCYYLYSKLGFVGRETSKEDCEAQCKTLDPKSQLALIASKEENDFIRDNILLGGGTPTTYFGGPLYSFSFSNWVDGPGPCPVMLYDGKDRGKWLGTDCTTGSGKPWGCCTADCICKYSKI